MEFIEFFQSESQFCYIIYVKNQKKPTFFAEKIPTSCFNAI